MNKKTYYYTVSVIFSIIALLHLLRALYGWETEVAGVIIPIWFSWVAVALAGYLAFRGFVSIKKL
ncbi:MAG TPA: hypothetical protein VFQ59_00655 [Candidatus Paceibacterota bacterium]|nr:hypothetical protein [Candidatus Paceibacterota bacterium]